MANAISSVKRCPSPVTISQIKIHTMDQTPNYLYGVGQAIIGASDYDTIALGSFTFNNSSSFTYDGYNFPFVEVFGSNDLSSWTWIGNAANTTYNIAGYNYVLIRAGIGADTSGYNNWTIVHNVVLK